MEKISPQIDIAFKKLFGVEENKDLLISLINSIVSLEDQVGDIVLLNPYNPKNFRNDKLSILDIKARGSNGKRYNIEIQISDEADYDRRALYYWAKLYTEQLKSGEDYSLLEKAIGIHILQFTSILENKKYHNIFHITEKETYIPYFKDLELHTIELNKFAGAQDKEVNELVTKVKTSLDMWVAFLTRHDLLNKERLPQPFNHTSLKKAMDVLEVLSFDEEERQAYEERLKWFRVEANTLKKMRSDGFKQGKEVGWEEGKAAGIAEGLKEGKAAGIAEGLKEGKAKGRAEGLEEGKQAELQEVIRKMKEKGKSLEEIAELLDLSSEEIKKREE